MKDDFRERLELYKSGKLNKEEVGLVEAEIERYAVIRDYLDEKEEEFLAGLKQELDRKAPVEKSLGRKINRKMLFKIVGLSLITLIACLIFVPVAYLSGASLLGSMTRVEGERFAQEQSFADQFIHMVSPQVNVAGGSNHTEFYKQSFTCGYSRGISRKAAGGQIEVNYSMGRLKKPREVQEKPLTFYPSDSFYAINSQPYLSTTEWELLEKAPKGTRAQLFVTFTSRLSPDQAGKALGEQYLDPDKEFQVDMLTDTGSPVVLANSYSPSGYYEQHTTSTSKQDELGYINQYNAFNNDVHKQLLLFGLNQIKKYRNIADYITAYYSSYGEPAFQDIDGMISYVEKNGVQYVGALISGDTKELLKLKGNPAVYACRVEEVVVW